MPVRWSVMRSGETVSTAPIYSGVSREPKEVKRSTASWSAWTRSICDGLICASTTSLSLSGTTSMMSSPRIDHAADRMGGELIDRAADRGDDGLLLDLIVGGDLALEEFVEPRRRLGELLRRLAPHVLVDLDDLQLGPGDLGPGLGDAGDDLPKLAIELRERGISASVMRCVETRSWPRSVRSPSTSSFASALWRRMASSWAFSPTSCCWSWLIFLLELVLLPARARARPRRRHWSRCGWPRRPSGSSAARAT